MIYAPAKSGNNKNSLVTRPASRKSERIHNVDLSLVGVFFLRRADSKHGKFIYAPRKLQELQGLVVLE